LSDNMRARIMKPDGTYVRLKPPGDSKAVDVQVWLSSPYELKRAAAQKR
jgi:hypothetical protein